jgi:hypothetical protein
MGRIDSRKWTRGSGPANPCACVARPKVHRELQRREVLTVLEYAAFLTAARALGPTHHAIAVLGVGEAQLGARMRPLAAGDDPHPRWPRVAGWAQITGQLGDLRADAGAAVGVQRCLPRLPGQRGQRVRYRLVGVETDRIVQAEGVDVVPKACTPAPLSPRTSTRARCSSGSWVSASVSTVMWSAALFAVAFPVRSSPATGSPVPPGPWSRKASNGWNPNVRFQVGVAPSVSECASTIVASRSITTGPRAATGARSCQTRDRALARAARNADRHTQGPRPAR